MNKNILIVLGGAIAVAVVVAVLVQVTLGGAKKEVVKVPQEVKIDVLVAAKDLPVGHKVKQGDVGWQKWSEKSVFPGIITKKGDEKSWQAGEGRLARGVTAGEPILKSTLLSGNGNFVAASLDQGMRAVSIKVSASTMVSGFIGPGDHVDVILTYKESIKTDGSDPALEKHIQLNLNKMATETILQNVKVLAVDQTAQKAGDDKIKVGKTVTVAVTLKDAERLALASELGDLTLTLRGVGDHDLVEKSWPIVSDQRLTKMNDEILSEYSKTKNGTGIPSNIVRIYKGSSVEEMSAK